MYFLEDDVVGLRPLSVSDVGDEYIGWLNDKVTCEGNSHCKLPYTKEQAEKYIEGMRNSKDDLVLAIIDKESVVHIGNASLQGISWLNRSAEFAILIGSKNHRGKGVGFRVARLLFGHGFKQLNLHRIYCGTYDNNNAMKKIASRMNMKECGVMREAAFKNGQYLDVVMYDLLDSEYYR